MQASLNHDFEEFFSIYVEYLKKLRGIKYRFSRILYVFGS